MTVLTRPRHRLVAEALSIARVWCAGHSIDGAPALGHAVEVALKLGEHAPDAPAELVAAVLLHDAPYFAPPAEDLDATLTARLSPSVARIVRALETEHQALAGQGEPRTRTDDDWVLQASAADKIVSFTSILTQAASSHDPHAYWHTRRPFLARLPRFRSFHTQASAHLPHTMTAELGRLIDTAESMTARIR
ncbi:MAG: metal-dependent phosphohydrolase [Nitriliruptorales bacterium]|nr:metal-dependent phosphohydrolase [Nitriliruptorales bacterium]